MRTLTSLLVIVSVVACLIASIQGQEDKKVEPKVLTSKHCRLYSTGQSGTTCYYYVQRCSDNAGVPEINTCPQPTASCSTPHPPPDACFNAHYVNGRLGLLPPDDKEHITNKGADKSSKDCKFKPGPHTKVLGEYFVKLKHDAKDRKVCLVLLEAKPKKSDGSEHPLFIGAFGSEITSSDVPTINIPDGDVIPLGGKQVEVRLGGVSFLVLLQ
jgi:hypothetical protein